MSRMQDPGAGGAAITPSDSTELTGVRGIYVGGDGNLAVVFVNTDTAVTHFGVKAGSYLPIRVKKVMATNTTATNIVAWF